MSATLRPVGSPAAPTTSAGTSRLEAEIARYAGLSRSVVASGDDVVTTAGAQQALDLVARVLLEPGDVVAVEDPGYTAAARLFETHRAVVRGVPVDGEGLVVDALPDAARLVYVTPSHQYPTGVAMSRARRIALLEWAVRHGAVIVEDDYDSEFRFADRPLEPLQSLDRDGRVVYVGSFSKSLLPGPAGRLCHRARLAHGRPCGRRKRVTVWDGDAVTQWALADFLAEGHHAAHVQARDEGLPRPTRGAAPRPRRGASTDWLEVVPSAAGLHVVHASCATRPRRRRASPTRRSRSGVFVDPLSTRHLEQPAAPRARLRPRRHTSGRHRAGRSWTLLRAGCSGGARPATAASADDRELRGERDDAEDEDHRHGEAEAQVVRPDRSGEHGAEQRADVVELVEARDDLVDPVDALARGAVLPPAMAPAAEKLSGAMVATAPPRMVKPTTATTHVGAKTMTARDRAATTPLIRSSQTAPWRSTSPSPTARARSVATR